MRFSPEYENAREEYGPYELFGSKFCTYIRSRLTDFSNEPGIHGFKYGGSLYGKLTTLTAPNGASFLVGERDNGEILLQLEHGEEKTSFTTIQIEDPRTFRSVNDVLWAMIGRFEAVANLPDNLLYNYVTLNSKYRDLVDNHLGRADLIAYHRDGDPDFVAIDQTGQMHLVPNSRTQIAAYPGDTNVTNLFRLRGQMHLAL